MLRIRCVAALVMLCGCGRVEAGAPEHPERLDGGWTLELRLTDPVQLNRDATRTPPVRGEVVLVENGPIHDAGLGGAPTHFGTYTADLHPFALPRPPAGRVPTLALRLLRSDSVEAVLDPGEAGSLDLAGKLAGDSVAGRWRYSAGRGGEARGWFVMRHR